MQISYFMLVATYVQTLGGLKCSEMSHRVVENTDSYSLECTSQILSKLQNKMVRFTTYFTTGKFTEKETLRLRRLSSCHEIIRKNAVLAVEHIDVKRGP